MIVVNMFPKRTKIGYNFSDYYDNNNYSTM